MNKVANHGVPSKDGLYKVLFDNGELNTLERTIRVTGNTYKIIPDGGTYALHSCMHQGDAWVWLGK